MSYSLCFCLCVIAEHLTWRHLKEIIDSCGRCIAIQCVILVCQRNQVTFPPSSGCRLSFGSSADDVWVCSLSHFPSLEKKSLQATIAFQKNTTETMPDLEKQECHVRQHTVTRLMIIELREEVTSITHKTLVVFVRHTWGSLPVPFLCWNKAGFRPSPDCLD